MKPLIIINSEDPYDISIEPGENLVAKIFMNFEHFNRYEINSQMEFDYINNCKDKLFNNSVGQKLNEANSELIKEVILPFYIRASVVAKKYQSIYHAAGLAVYIISPLAVAALASAILVPRFALIFSIMEFFLLLVILSVLFLTNRINAHKTWIQYRYLAECLRASIFFIACGVRPEYIYIPSSIKLTHKQDDWVLRLYNEILRLIPEVPQYQNKDCKTLTDYIVEYWIKDQINYHRNVSVSFRTRAKRLELIGLILFVSALIASATHILVGLLELESYPEWSYKAITFAAIVFPAIGASLGAIRIQREFARIEKRSENMAYHLEELIEEQIKILDLGDLKYLINSIKEITLRESQDWLMLMKFAKVEAV